MNSRCLIETPSRLICQEYSGIIDQCTCNSYALTLTSTQLGNGTPFRLGDIYCFKGMKCAFHLTTPHDCSGQLCSVGVFGVRVRFVRV